LLLLLHDLRRWGNSLGIRIPKYIVEELALVANGEVECRLENGAIVIQPIDRLGKYTLAQLLAAELEPDPEVEWGAAMGDEEW
jgi:antitoxin MazE